MIHVIVAMDRERVIGSGGRLPWRLPEDLRRFKRLTFGHPVIVGRRTYASLGGPLAGRTNVVVTRQAGYRAHGCLVAHDLDEAFRLARAAPGGEELWVIGGGEIYASALARAEFLHVTHVDTLVAGGDARFPEIDPALWAPVDEDAHPADDRHAHPYRFVTYRRRPVP
jgi:dihydrofolate reductase